MIRRAFHLYKVDAESIFKSWTEQAYFIWHSLRYSRSLCHMNIHTYVIVVIVNLISVVNHRVNTILILLHNLFVYDWLVITLQLFEICRHGCVTPPLPINGIVNISVTLLNNLLRTELYCHVLYSHRRRSSTAEDLIMCRVNKLVTNSDRQYVNVIQIRAAIYQCKYIVYVCVYIMNKTDHKIMTTPILKWFKFDLCRLSKLRFNFNIVIFILLI